MRGKKTSNNNNNNKNLEERAGRKHWEGKYRVGKPETALALANRMALSCLFEFLSPLVTVSPGSGEGAERTAPVHPDHRPSAGTLGDLGEVWLLPLPAWRAVAVYSSPQVCLPVLAAKGPRLKIMLGGRSHYYYYY